MRQILRCVLILPLLSSVMTVRSGLAQQRASASEVSEKEPDLFELREKSLLFPVAGASIDQTRDDFNERRGRARRHHALDIRASRNTPVLSADAGRILKLYRSKLGGIMIYATDPSEHFIYLYAHLDHYREGLKEGLILGRGDTIGYVGTTGNAPPNTPHLHFGILRSSNVLLWSKGKPVNPFRVFSDR